MYYFSQYFQHYSSFFNLFQYISVRAIAALLSALFLACLFGSWFLRTSQRYFRAKAREFAPDRHQEKNDTPTMGGLFILMIFLINTLLWNNWAHPEVWLLTASLMSFGGIGVLDDWRKIHRQQGISSRLKFCLQLFCAGGIAVLWYFLCAPAPELCIPIFKNCNPYIGLMIIPWAIFVIVGASNAVNLTDGLDGLAAGPLTLNFWTFSIIAYLAGHKFFSAYLHMPYAGTAELAICGASLIGGLLGFLWYNSYPAQLFMGDVGSLALGAGLGTLAILTRQEFLLIISGGIFVLETVSVILQVVSFRYLGRRIFRMAPIHHHFELIGWNEVKITVRFWIISLVLCLIALLFLKIR